MRSRFTPGAVLRRTWLPLTAAVALGVAAVGMWQARQLSAPEPVVRVNPPQAPEGFTRKTLTFEVFGSAGSGVLLDYVDIDGYPQLARPDSLPWTHQETTTLAVVSGSIAVQVRGGYVGCRILVDGVVRDEHTNSRPDANVTCRVKSA